MQPSLNKRARQAREDPVLLDELMRAHRPLMLAAVRFHMHSVREEYVQIAEDAFREAVAAYRADRGAFLPLSRVEGHVLDDHCEYCGEIGHDDDDCPYAPPGWDD